jgi:hypothetical protein
MDAMTEMKPATKQTVLRTRQLAVDIVFSFESPRNDQTIVARNGSRQQLAFEFIS